MQTKKYRHLRAAAVILPLILLASCGKKVAEVSELAGVTRDAVLNMVDADTAEPETDDGLTKNPDYADSKSIWTVSDGKYVYNFPKRDDSGLASVDEMASMSTARFDDQPDDWFFAKTERNASTGEVKVVWERSQSTLDTIKKYNAIYRGDESRKVCYLTFDCGYEYGTTAKILDVLKEKSVPATFFVNGHYVKSASDMIQRMLDEGHIIGNHAVNHYDLTSVSVDTFIEELQGLEDLFYEKFPDAQPIVYFRPPSGDCNEWVLKLADKMGYTTVMWSWAYMDYDTNNQISKSDALERVKQGLHNGCVYLFHPESTTNADMLGDMIDWLRGEGYEILPLCDIGQNG